MPRLADDPARALLQTARARVMLVAIDGRPRIGDPDLGSVFVRPRRAGPASDDGERRRPGRPAWRGHRLLPIALSAFSGPQLSTASTSDPEYADAALWKSASDPEYAVVAYVAHAVFGAALPVLAHESAHNRARGRRLYRTLDRAIGIFAVAATAILIAFPEPILRLTYGSSFTGAASALRWTGIARLPLLTNASRRVYRVRARRRSRRDALDHRRARHSDRRGGDDRIRL